jgi:hypothetical protein
MTLKHILGVDHTVIAVRDLDAAAAQWQRLGFTLSPRGTHSPLLGTGNYTIMFEEDYLELLGVLAETEHNKPTRDFLERHEGLERTAFTTDDAAAGAAELVDRGLGAVGPIDFGRPVDLPDGRKSEARFSVFLWPLGENPGGMRIFACQHHTRETVWIPTLQTHANGARRIARIEILAAAPKIAAEHLARLIDAPITPEEDAWRVRSGGRRADFVFYDHAGFTRRYPDAVRIGAVSEGAAALAIETRDRAAAAKALGTRGVTHDGMISVPAHAANGVILSFATPP